MQSLPPPFLYAFKKFYLYRALDIGHCIGFLYELKSLAQLLIQQCNTVMPYAMNDQINISNITFCAYV